MTDAEAEALAAMYERIAGKPLPGTPTMPKNKTRNRKQPMRQSPFRQAGGRPPNQASAAVDRINQRHAFVLTGGDAAIIREKPDRSSFDLISLAALRAAMANDFVPVEKQSVPVHKIWLASPRRRQYLEGIVFDPSGTAPEGTYNLWKGFAFDPKPGNGHARFLEHLRENVAQGDEDLARWVEGWLAAIVQRPAEKAGTALVLRGKMGSGKTVVGRHFGRLLGPHYLTVSKSDQVVGRFNSHHASCMLLQAEEAVWAGSKEAEGVLKDLVTGESMQIEFKGRDQITMRNVVRLLMTSNEGWVVPAGAEERRFAVIDVGNGRLQDRAYFGAMAAEMEAGGYENLLHHLMQFDLTSVDVSSIPATNALAEQKMRSLSPELAWWFDCLTDGCIVRGSSEPNWPLTESIYEKNGAGRGELIHPAGIDCNAFYDQYRLAAKDRGARRIKSKSELREDLVHVIPGIIDKTYRPMGKPRRYVLPSLQECRNAWDTEFKTKIDWK